MAKPNPEVLCLSNAIRLERIQEAVEKSLKLAEIGSWVFAFVFYFMLLYNTVLVFPYINMNLPPVYTCSPSWTLLPPPSPSYPSGSSQCTNSGHPVSCIKPGLAICFTYDILHVSMPFSHIIPPSPSPTESKSFFFCLFCCLTYRVIITIFLNSIYMC